MNCGKQDSHSRLPDTKGEDQQLNVRWLEMCGWFRDRNAASFGSNPAFPTSSLRVTRTAVPTHILSPNPLLPLKRERECMSRVNVKTNPFRVARGFLSIR